jgi:arylsulfate sulfotransferase
MKRRTVQILLSSGLFAIINFISGCNAGSFSEGPTPAPAPVITPSSAVLLPGQTLQFNATVNGAPLANAVWLVDRFVSGGTAIGTITPSGLYTAPTGSAPTAVQLRVRDLTHNTQSTPVKISIFQPGNFQPGTVSASKNPLVALYTFSAPQGAVAQIQFGTSTNYGLTTWAQPAPEGGGAIGILVAGMRSSTTYHMQAIVHLPNGNTLFDTDQVFTTGALPANLLPNLTVQQTAGMTPAPGVELLCLFEEASQTQLTAVVTDLAGNVIWYYPIQPSPPFPMKLLPNGHMLVSTFDGTQNQDVVQEIDLAGNTISQVSLADVQQGLATAGLSFPTLASIHHDIAKLPNGHLILLVNYNQTFTDQPGVTTVLGDALIDWDPERGPVWTWSTFDHIPLTHAPNGTTDWTHSNAVVYSPDDGNLILSMRNQNWIIKINYVNGAGDGRILWHLGQDGDFTLPSGQAPIEWNYGQHYPVLLGPNSAGIFPLMFFNNGNNRLVDTNDNICDTPGLTTCYSSVPIFQLNEYMNTAQVLEETDLSPAYSVCCGSANQLANGDLEYDVALDINSANGSYIQEVTRGQTSQVVWQMNVTGQLTYRGFRIPSLYPGVEWTQSAIANATAAVQPARMAVKQ